MHLEASGEETSDRREQSAEDNRQEQGKEDTANGIPGIKVPYAPATRIALGREEDNDVVAAVKDDGRQGHAI